MIFKDPRITPPPATRRDVQYEDTEQVPAIMDKYSGVSPWPVQKWSPPPYWRNLLPKPSGTIDFEKLGFRLIVASFALFTIIMTIMMLGKILAATAAITIR